MGAAESSQLTTRPSFVRAMSPASSSTRRCLMKPGSDIWCAWASSQTGRSPSASDCSTWRRVRSESAANTLSSSSSEYLTIRFSIRQPRPLCQALLSDAELRADALDHGLQCNDLGFQPRNVRLDSCQLSQREIAARSAVRPPLRRRRVLLRRTAQQVGPAVLPRPGQPRQLDYQGSGRSRDRKSTRLNSSHGYISYAVFCLKKKTTTQ